MKILSLARHIFGVAASAALLAGCSATGTQPSLINGAPTAPAASGGHHLTPLIQKLIAMTRADHEAPPQLAPCT